MTMFKNVNGIQTKMTAKEEAEFLASVSSLSQPKLIDFQIAVQTVIDEAARAERFNDGVALASYVTSTVEPWAAQAQAFVAWRDDVWQYAYSELSKVEAGEREQPSVADFLMELPQIVWPS